MLVLIEWTIVYLTILLSTFSVSGTIAGGMLLIIISFFHLTQKTSFVKDKVPVLFISLFVLISWLAHRSSGAVNLKNLSYVYKPLFLLSVLPLPSLFRKKIHIIWLYFLLIISSAGALFAIITSAKTSFKGMGHLPYLGPQESAGILSVFLVFEVSALVYLNLRNKEAILVMLSSLLKTSAIILTFSRTYLLFLPVMWFLLIFEASRRKSKKTLISMSILLAMITGIAIFESGMEKEVKNMLSTTYSTNFMRLCMWKVSVKEVLKHPMLGRGGEYFSEKFIQEVMNEKGCGSQIWSSVAHIMYDPHNAFLTLAIYGGLPALFLYLWYIATFFLRMWRWEPNGSWGRWLRSSLLLSGLCLFIVGGTFERHPVGDPILAVIAGIITGVYPYPGEDR